MRLVKASDPSTFFRCSLFCLAVVLFAGTVQAKSDKLLGVGDRPPEYLGLSHDKQKVHLSDSNGRIRVITFWASWCGPCRKELGVLHTIQDRAGADRIQVIAINLKEKTRIFEGIRKQFSESAMIWARDRRGRTAKSFGVQGIPHMVIVDIDGTIVHRHIGYNESGLPQIVTELNNLMVKRFASNSDEASTQ